MTILTVGGAGPGVGAATPFGGAARFLGTNPWSMGIPVGNQDHPPVLIDFATTVVAEGKVKVARAKHEALPAGCIVDKDGNPSTDPEEFYGGGMLLPFGGHKGYGLALASALMGTLAVIDDATPTLAGNLGDTRTGADLAARGAGAFLVVIDPSAFGDATHYRDHVERVTDALKKVPGAGSNTVMLPGEPESRTTASRKASGISATGRAAHSASVTSTRNSPFRLSRRIRSPSRTLASGPPAAASGDTWMAAGTLPEAPLMRPSVTSATLKP